MRRSVPQDLAVLSGRTLSPMPYREFDLGHQRFTEDSLSSGAKGDPDEGDIKVLAVPVSASRFSHSDTRRRSVSLSGSRRRCSAHACRRSERVAGQCEHLPAHGQESERQSNHVPFRSSASLDRLPRVHSPRLGSRDVGRARGWRPLRQRNHYGP